MKFEEFNNQLKLMTANDVVQKYIFESFPCCFSSNPTLYYDFRKEICDFFHIHPQNFCIVGSAKTGFSLNPEKFGRPFADESDIDVVLVSDELFQSLWIDLIEFRKTVLFGLDYRYRKSFEDLQRILFYGTIRLDKLSNDFSFAKIWWEFFNKISVDSRYGPRRIRAAIFKTWKHASYYYEISVVKLREKL